MSVCNLLHSGWTKRRAEAELRRVFSEQLLSVHSAKFDIVAELRSIWSSHFSEATNLNDFLKIWFDLTFVRMWRIRMAHQVRLLIRDVICDADETYLRHIIQAVEDVLASFLRLDSRFTLVVLWSLWETRSRCFSQIPSHFPSGKELFTFGSL